MTTLPISTFSPNSFWLDEEKNSFAALPPLVGNKKFDLVIIGAGYSGLSAAIELRKAGHSVAVVEAGRSGFGASGRNCGQVAIDLGANPLWTLKMHGLEKSQRLANVLARAIKNVQTNIDLSGQDCDYVANGNIMGGVHDSHTDKLQAFSELYNSVGLKTEMLDRSALTRRGIPKSIVCGFHEKMGGTLNPVKYVRCLVEIALAEGVEIFENSPVSEIKPGNLVMVTTSSGSITAEKCVLATNAYSGELGKLKHTVVPLSVSALVTKPLSEEQRSRIGWHGQEGLHTSHRVIENLRLTPDGRILVGTKRARLGYGAHHPKADDPKIFNELAQVLRQRFPEIPEVEIDIGWTGRVAISADFIPAFGNMSRQDNIYYAAGYGGHGIALASYSGKVISDFICDKDLGDAGVLVNRKKLPLPPEPFRWLVIQSMLSSMGIADKKLDRAAGKAQ